MSTQQDIYAAGSESHPPMLNKEKYVPWSSCLLHYAKSRPNGKLIHNSIINGPYVRRMIPEPGDTNRDVPVNETFHVQTDDELTKKELKKIEADDQAIQTILLGLPEDIYAAVDSCETAQEIWLRVQQMMKGSDIGIQEKKAKLFNEWERFTSNEGESIESYYHRFLKLMNDLKRNKHFPENIASNLKFLNNLQPEWSRHVTIVHQTKDLHTADYTQLYDFLKYNQQEVDELKAERLAKIQDPLALMENSNNPYVFPAPHQEQPSFNQNYMQQPMANPEDITDPTTAINMALALMAKAFKLNYSTLTNNNQRISSNPRNRQIAQPGMNMGQDRQMQMVGGNGGNQFRQYAGQNVGNLTGYNDLQNNGLIGVPGNANLNVNGNLVATRAEENAAGQNENQIRCYNCRGVGHYTRNGTVRPRRRDAAYLQTRLLIAQKEEAGIQLQAEEFDLMADAADLDEIEEVNANCILMANLQQASTSGTQSNKASVYDSDGSADVHDYENCDDNEIFNMFTQEEQYTEILEPIPEPHQVPQNDNSIISEDSSAEQSGETVEQHPVNFEETRALYDSLYHNLAIEVEKVNSKLESKNVELEFQVLNYARENAHLKATYKNLFDSISVSRTQTKTIIASFQNKLQSTIYKNAKLRTQLFKKVFDQKDNTHDTRANTKFVKQPIVENLPKVGETHALSKPVTLNSVSTPQESKGMNIDKVIAPGMFRINPFKTSREEKHVPNTVRASNRTKPITVSQPPVFTKKDVNFDLNGLSSTGDVISKVVCAMCKQCLISVNHDVCFRNYVNGKNSRGKEQTTKVSFKENQKKYQPKVKKPKKVGFLERLATPKPRKPRFLLRWSPTGRLFDQTGNVIQICLWCVDSGCSKHMTGNLKLLINFVWKFMGIVCFGNDHVAAILGFGDLQWGNILITRVYFVEGLGHNLFSVGQLCNSNLEVAFRRNACFVRNLEGVDLLKGDRSTNLYTINLHEMASASQICLMARASSTKSWLFHQRLSHLNFDTINDLARNDLISGLPKFKYNKEHLCLSCEQGKGKRASHPPKPVPNSRQRLHLLHMDLCGPMRIASINGKRYVLVIVDDYSRYTWVHFLGSKDEAPKVIITFLKRITVLLQSPVIIIRTDNGTKFKNQVLKEYFDTVGNDREDIGKLGAKGDIGFFIGYSADSCAYRIFNRRTKKIMETMNVSFNELSAMAFEQRSSKPGL
nr:retrovirus-related Pol polyprotein from transposon TNT 1-94 [Tanacetum cinerariifolium]